MPERLLTHVEFRSTRFPAFDGEEDMINPGLWGKLLADFLREGLLANGYEIPEPIAEDWGWRVEVRNQPFRTWIGCGHYPEYHDGFLCFIEPHKPYVWRIFRRVGTKHTISELRNSIDAILDKGEAIHSKKWWTHEEFNYPGRKA